MQAATLEGGFADPSRTGAHAFRAIMEAMARPGTIRKIAGARPPSPLSPAAGAVLLTLCDADTPLHLAGAVDCPEVRAWLAFHTGAPFAPAEDADFAVGPWDALVPLDRYRSGTPDYPDRSATLVVELPSLRTGGSLLRGPGIRDRAELPLPDAEVFRANARRFPLGLDFVFAAGDEVAALPRSIEVL